MAQVLDVSYNSINSSDICALSSLPSLRELNMNHNNLGGIPQETIGVEGFPSLERLYAAGNRLASPSLLSLTQVLNCHTSSVFGFPHIFSFL